MIRDDLTDRLVHFTRGTWEKASNVLLTILEQRMLKGSSKDVRGGYKCVCFSEAPIGKMSMILARGAEREMRYAPFGIMVSKAWLYQKGGRPVIYQSNDEFDLLNDLQKYRHVKFEPQNKIDYTWEREWRVETDGIPLDPAQTTVVVPTRGFADKLRNNHFKQNQGLAIAMGEIGGMAMSDFPWHFVALEDLGVNIPFE